jgi:hypothetical protein
VKLSYEKIVHKKVYDAALCMTVPEGEKYFAWLKNGECILLHITEGKTISRFQKFTIANALQDTILYGTLILIQGKQWFHTEDILYYQGKFTNVFSVEKKWSLLRELFVKEKMKNLCKEISFGVPLLSTCFEDIRKQMMTLSYPIRYIRFQRKYDRTIYYLPSASIESTHLFSHTNTNTNAKNNAFTENAIFIVTPDIQNDIYHLSFQQGIYDSRVAAIPDYKTSVMMNRLFRNIKENQCLDTLEESDDEEEFENNNIDKYVYLDRSYRMLCRYNRKFGKWVPLRVVKQGDRGLSREEIIRLERNKIYR